MKTFSFATSLVLITLVFSNAEDDSRFGVQEAGMRREIVDRNPDFVDETIMVGVEGSTMEQNRGIHFTEDGLPHHEDPKIHRDTIESNNPWLPDSSQHQTNLVIPANKTPGTIRGGGLTTRQDLVPVGDLEPNARSITSQNTVDINDEDSDSTQMDKSTNGLNDLPPVSQQQTTIDIAERDQDDNRISEVSMDQHAIDLTTPYNTEVKSTLHSAGCGFVGGIGTLVTAVSTTIFLLVL